MLLCLIVSLIDRLAFAATSLESKDNNYFLSIRMPNVTPQRVDELICTAAKLDPRESYIVRFTPHASKASAHHMMLYGCRSPASFSPSWICNQNQTPSGPSHDAVCLEDTKHIVFAWALDAPEKALPEGVGLRVSGDTGINYLVVQLHYAKAFPPGVTDNSGYTLEMTNSRPPQQVGYLVLGNWGVIPPQKYEFYLDSFCEFPLNDTVYPIAYRTHSHNLGVVTSGYRIRAGLWVEIGRNSPQLPQAFYKVSNPGMNIRPGDVLASRCVMNSVSRDKDTIIGPRNHDEMCNFYIMYTTYQQRNLEDIMCFQKSNSDTSRDVFPPDSGSLDGIPGADKVKKKFRTAASLG
ncbi:unnamed protein product [Candidula unifasciata]|uniref:peptidylglycine monooxygenase n=1 Tax=Candidula unifasciata TaxID=100452 RepID=A0A8S3YRN8_9EUPU|nr:unnamed protein product [Candidula unifasciata]